ncbi:MAG: cytochrome c oxidase assembly protein [Parvibaculum sp.]|uniref:cytochrome c oxidase assembly protein n=1 Tax=Parvibaculum sp. TaxID=2024848 RepID=UPI0027276046|nr:cytochrome c oxidase assembly protein [Parvibaculum sp.]MDO8837336.1 cytochrome c oxidase assembly protein [Parvibaculum sp.]
MKILGTHIPPVALSGAILAMMTTAVVYSPTLYEMFCAATGYGGTVSVNRPLRADLNEAGPPITVRFDANISPGLKWDFRPAQRDVQTRIGLPTTVYYHATNTSDETLVGRATFNVTPESAGYFFNKTECFCFVEQKLAPGESAEMPIVFFVDPEMLDDVDAKGIRTITLSYTFFRQTSDEDAIASARSLREGSERQKQDLAIAETAEFSIRAPHVR